MSLPKSNTHIRSLLGFGIAPNREYSIRGDTLIRPTSLDSDIEHLKSLTTNQFDFGFLCSLAPRVSFEIQIAAPEDRAAAIKLWNAQWDLVLLSIICRTEVSWPFEYVPPSKMDETGTIRIKNRFIGSLRHVQPKTVTETEIAQFAEMEKGFSKLLKESPFVHASSIASTTCSEPKPSVKMAAIWSGIEALLGIEQELRFRISIAVSKLLHDQKEARHKRFTQVKKLYDLRSKSVHGNSTDPKKLDAAVEESYELLCELIEFFIRKGSLLSASEMDEVFFR